MEYITVDAKQEIFYFPKKFFTENYSELLNYLPNGMFLSESESHVIFQGPRVLPKKMEADLLFRREKEREMTCVFCKERLRCTTEGFEKCNGYQPKEQFLISYNKLESYLKEKKMPILYARMS